ncbi:hypothetical protein BH11PSE8_BH11PSE8_38870 [soil metagenome]
MNFAAPLGTFGPPRKQAVRIVAIGLCLALAAVLASGWLAVRDAKSISTPQYSQSEWHAFRLRDTFVQAVATASAVREGRATANELDMRIGLVLSQSSAVDQYIIGSAENAGRLKTELADIDAAAEKALDILEAAQKTGSQLQPETAQAISDILDAQIPAVKQLVIDAHQYATDSREATRERLLSRLYLLAAAMAALSVLLAILVRAALAAYREQRETTKFLEVTNANLENLVAARTEELILLATTDGLTSLLNRRAVLERAKDVLRSSDRHRRPCSLLAMDVDHFKRVNDTHGHPVGDEVLKGLADVFTRTIRATDFVGRIGGEEFVVMLPETGGQEALVIAERLRTACSAWSMQRPKEPALSVTISVGVIERLADEPIERMLVRADEALYRAKRAGRNTVVLA